MLEEALAPICTLSCMDASHVQPDKPTLAGAILARLVETNRLTHWFGWCRRWQYYDRGFDEDVPAMPT